MRVRKHELLTSHQMHDSWQVGIVGDQNQELATLQTAWATSRIDDNAKTGEYFYTRTNEGAKQEAAEVNYTRAGLGGKTNRYQNSEHVGQPSGSEQNSG